MSKADFPETSAQVGRFFLIARKTRREGWCIEVSSGGVTSPYTFDTIRGREDTDFVRACLEDWTEDEIVDKLRTRLGRCENALLELQDDIRDLKTLVGSSETAPKTLLDLEHNALREQAAGVAAFILGSLRTPAFKPDETLVETARRLYNIATQLTGLKIGQRYRAVASGTYSRADQHYRLQPGSTVHIAIGDDVEVYAIDEAGVFARTKSASFYCGVGYFIGPYACFSIAPENTTAQTKSEQ